jgi:hypothetical protein
MDGQNTSAQTTTRPDGQTARGTTRSASSALLSAEDSVLCFVDVGNCGGWERDSAPPTHLLAVRLIPLFSLATHPPTHLLYVWSAGFLLDLDA